MIRIFSATKIKWILDHVEGSRERAERGELLFGTVDTWLIWKLTNGAVHVTDFTNASRTMLLISKNLNGMKNFTSFRYSSVMLPEVRSSSEVYGYTHTISGQKLVSPLQESQVINKPHCLVKCVLSLVRQNTYGTGCFLLMNTGKKIVRSEHGLLTTIACGASGE